MKKILCCGAAILFIGAGGISEKIMETVFALGAASLIGVLMYMIASTYIEILREMTLEEAEEQWEHILWEKRQAVEYPVISFELSGSGWGENDGRRHDVEIDCGYIFDDLI